MKRKLNMGETKNLVGNITLFSLIFIILLFLYCWSPSTSNPLFSLGNHQFPLSNSTTINLRVKNELEEALIKAAMPNKTLIIAMVNKAYVETTTTTLTMFDLFLESFWLGDNETRPLLDNLLIVAVDQTSYERCKFRRLHCYRLSMKTDGEDGSEDEKVYMSDAFIKMMWRRTFFLLEVLKRGYNFIFTDADIMWLRNPFHVLSTNSNVDFQISTDKFCGDDRSENNEVNTGFYYIKSNNKTISLFQNWYSMKDNSTGKKEQDVLHDMMRNGAFRQLGLNVTFLDTIYFSGFCEKSRDVRQVITVHANCCRTIGAKVADLTALLGDWKRFKQFGPGNEINISIWNRTMTSTTFEWSMSNACLNSWGQ